MTHESKNQIKLTNLQLTIDRLLIAGWFWIPMTGLRKEILSTLALNHAESGAGLELSELHKYLHRIGNSGRPPTLGEITKEIYELKKDGLVLKENNLCGIIPVQDFAKQKAEQRENSERKLEKLKRPLDWLAVLPFLKTIAVTGSVASKTASQKSDLDLFIITIAGRIWTVRTLAMIVTQIFGKRRYGKKIADRICLNYLIADKTQVSIQNIASANMFLNAMPILAKTNYAEFIKQNHWLGNFLYNYPKADFFSPFELRYPTKISAILEMILRGKLGNCLEHALKKWQMARIKKKIAGKTGAGQLICADEIIMLHYPDPKNMVVMKRYDDKMRELYCFRSHSNI